MSGTTTNTIGTIIRNPDGIDLSGGRLTSVALCTQNLDGANKDYVDSQVLTGVNIGDGSDVFKQKTGNNLEFRSFLGNNNTFTSDSTFIFANNDMFYAPYPLNILDSTLIPNIDSASNKYDGSTLGVDGKIYAVPGSSTNVLIVDPKNRTADTTSLIVPPGSFKWNGAVTGPNGKIFGIPGNTGVTTVLIIDTVNKTTDTSTLTGIVGGWEKGVLHANGKIYCVPSNATNVLIIDPINLILDTTTLSTIANSSAIEKWRDCSIAQNGKIYCSPRQETRILIIDPYNNTLDTTSMPLIPYGGTPTSHWFSCTIAQNGIIYSIPFNSTRILIINPFNSTISLIGSFFSIGSGSNKWADCILAPNGKIYSPPFTYTTFLIFDPITNVSDTSTIPAGNGSGSAFNSTNIGPDGRIYATPLSESRILAVGTGIISIPMDLSIGTNMNK